MDNYRDPFIGYDQWKTTDPFDQDFDEDPHPEGEPETVPVIRWHECTGCNARSRISLLVRHGQEHRNCPKTNGVVGYWVEIPDDGRSAAERDYLKSWGVED
jgi:hypothetical protein